MKSISYLLHFADSCLAHLYLYELTPRPFKFIIGPDEVPIVVHEAVLAEQSPALAAILRGEMAESVAGESRWMDVDKGTFIQFAQFAYTGYY